MTVARTVPQTRSALGGILQFCGCLLLRNSRRQNHRTRNDPGFRSYAICGDRWAGGSNREGSSNLVVGPAHFFLACIDRWLRGRCHLAVRIRSDHPCRLSKTLVFIFVAPLMGLILGFSFMVAIFWLLRNKAPQRVDAWFRRLQLLSAAAYSIGHGGNDAQKTMGIVATALYGAKFLTRSELAGGWGRFHWPIILAAHASIALGTYLGGWRIVHTMGSRITKLRPVGGFCAETAGAITLFSASLAGIPVSTTHTITGAFVGVGATTRLSAVRWGIARRIVVAWILTIPASGIRPLQHHERGEEHTLPGFHLVHLPDS